MILEKHWFLCVTEGPSCGLQFNVLAQIGHFQSFKFGTRELPCAKLETLKS